MQQLAVRYSTWAALQRDAMNLSQGMFLKTPTKADQFARVEVHLELPDGETHVMPSEVVSVVPGQALAVQWRPDARDAVEKVLAAAMNNKASDPARSDEPSVIPVEEDADDDKPVFADRESLQAQIEGMSIQEKRQAAMHGRKEMRWLLVRDHNKSIHPFVIKNPAITLDEVEQIARLTSVNPEVLHVIAQNREWTRSGNVVRNLVKNPKTPMPDAVALLEKLAPGDVRAIAKSPSVRMPIQMAARKKINS
jgi:hypothetical protein